MGCDQCTAITNKRRRCKLKTCRSNLCWIHLDKERGLKISKSKLPDAGLGLYTTKTRGRNEKVTEYSGKVLSEEQADSENPNNLYLLQIGRNKVIDASNPKEIGLGRWINDCRTIDRRNNNCRGQNTKFAHDRRNNKVNIKTNRRIQKNEELYIPYSRSYWT